MRMAWGAVCLAAIALLLGWLRVVGPHAAAVPLQQRPARAVRVANAERRDMPIYVRGLGTVEPYNDVAIKSRVDGQILAIRFEEGQTVQAGDVLFEIDPRPYQVQVALAEANLARDKVQQVSAEADLGRITELLPRGFLTPKDFDTQKALVGRLQATSKADQVQIDAARVQLEYCTIRAPIGGRVGKRMIDVGNVVLAADSKPLVEVAQVDPIAVSFTVLQDALPEIQRRMRDGALAVELRSPDDRDMLATGKLTLIGNAIDQQTGTIALKAVFANGAKTLWPGQFVNVRVVLNVLPGAVVLPVAAVQLGADGMVAYVVRADHRVTVRRVTIGTRSDDLVAVTAGVAAGETVVIEGQDGLADRSPVAVIAPAPAL